MKNEHNRDIELIIEVLPETQLTSATDNAISVLLDTCFPDTFEGRSYFKQIPHGRILAWKDGALAGHMGYDLRIMRFGEQLKRVFGIIDLCVEATQRQQGIGAALLQTAISHAEEARADAMLLVTQQPSYYTRFGFVTVSTAAVTWLGIEDRRSVGLLTESLAGEIMVRVEKNTPLPIEQIDMLGYLY